MSAGLPGTGRGGPRARCVGPSCRSCREVPGAQKAQVAPNFGPGVRGIGGWRAVSELLASLKRADWETRPGRAPRLARPLPAAPLSAPHLAETVSRRAHTHPPPYRSPYASPYRTPPHPSSSTLSHLAAQVARHEPLRFHFVKVDIAHPPTSLRPQREQGHSRRPNDQSADEAPAQRPVPRGCHLRPRGARGPRPRS